MALVPLTNFPQSITSGDTVLLLLTFASAPSDGFTAVLKLNQAGAAPQSISGTVSGSGFQFVIPNTTTDAMATGAWTWAVRATETATGYVITAGAGDFTVLADYADTITKSAAQQQLDAANTAFLTLVANPDASVSFNGQSFSAASKDELFGIIMRLKSLVASELAQAAGLRGDAPTRSIRPYFV